VNEFAASGLPSSTGAGAEAGAPDGDVPAMWSYEALLRELVDADRFPRLHRLAWTAEIGDTPSGYDETAEFLFGVDRMLDGVQALIDQKQGQPAGKKPGSDGKRA
jgi:hypothetical protein